MDVMDVMDNVSGAALCRFKTFVHPVHHRHNVHNVHFRFTVSSNCLLPPLFKFCIGLGVDDILVIVRKNDIFLCFFTINLFFLRYTVILMFL